MGKEHLPEYRDRINFPYTIAMVQETIRLKTVGRFNDLLELKSNGKFNNYQEISLIVYRMEVDTTR